MEVLLTSLDALLHKATGANLERPDPAALEAFCTILGESPNGAYIATRVIASRIRSPHPTEALLALDVLDACMKRCDSVFHSEVDKFRFLNEMIKLVSPKFYGNKTAPAVRQKVLSLMHSWTIDYPREIKIKDAYEMLKKQGVVKETPPVLPQEQTVVTKNRSKESIFEDEEKSKMLQKLLQSKNPDDLQAANRLIKSMVREGEQKIEAVTRQVSELHTIHNNIRLLDEMLDQYLPNLSSQEDLDLIKELFSECNRLRPTVFKLAADTQHNDDLLNEVLGVGDDLNKVFEKYTLIITQGKGKVSTENQQGTPASAVGNGSSLLDLAAPSRQSATGLPSVNRIDSKKSNVEVLDDIFSTVDNSKKMNEILEVNSIPTLQPVSLNTMEKNVKSNAPSTNKGLEELNALSEGLLKSSLPSSCKSIPSFNNQKSDKVPMNLMGKTEILIENMNDIRKDINLISQQSSSKNDLLDLDFLITKTLETEKKSTPQHLSADDIMVDLSSDDNLLDSKEKYDDPDTTLINCMKNMTVDMEKPSSSKQNNEHPSESQLTNNVIDFPSKPLEIVPKCEITNGNKPIEVKSLNDINITLDSIKPGDKSPLKIFEETNGITVVLHLAKNKPRPDVFVIVVSSTSRNPSPIDEYKFHAVVPKGCKIKQLPQSGDKFPAFTPFLPPAAVTQIILIARPIAKNPISTFLKFVITYVCQEDSVSEIGEVSNLPLDDEAMFD